MATIEKRINKNGKASFRAKVRLKGYPPQTASFERITDARKWVQDTESAIREGRHFKTAEAKKHTLAELIDRYIENVIPQKVKMGEKQKAQLEYWKDKIGDYLLSDVTPALLAECRDKLLQEETRRKALRSPATVNRYIAALSHAFTIAMKEWGWLEHNPMLKVTKPKEARGRVRFLSDDERKELLKVCEASSNKQLYVIVVLALSTGARKMEVLGLSWDDINFDRRTITLHETKNGERRLIPLVGNAYELMKAHKKVRHLHTNLVFPGKNKRKPIDIRKPWEEALKAAEIEDFRFHDLRHSAASYLAMNGASLAEIAEVLGHKTLQMVKRYAHLSEAHTAGVVERMNQNIFG